MESRFVRFLFVGCLNTVVGYLIYAILILLKFHYVFATLIATILGVIFNFKTTGKLVFHNDSNRLLFKFLGVYATTYCLNIGFLRIFEFYQVDLFIAGAILLSPMAIIAYVLNKKYVFRKEQDEG